MRKIADVMGSILLDPVKHHSGAGTELGFDVVDGTLEGA